MAKSSTSIGVRLLRGATAICFGLFLAFPTSAFASSSPSKEATNDDSFAAAQEDNWSNSSSEDVFDDTVNEAQPGSDTGVGSNSSDFAESPSSSSLESQLIATEENAALESSDDSVLEAPEAAVSASLSSDERVAELSVSGGLVGDATAVYFPVWSEEGGQDDIVWYEAVRSPDGSWRASAPVSAHRSAGEYAVHCYAVIAGARSLVGTSSFSVTAPTSDVFSNVSGASVTVDYSADTSTNGSADNGGSAGASQSEDSCLDGQLLLR